MAKKGFSRIDVAKAFLIFFTPLAEANGKEYTKRNAAGMLFYDHILI